MTSPGDTRIPIPFREYTAFIIFGKPVYRAESFRLVLPGLWLLSALSK